MIIPLQIECRGGHPITILLQRERIGGQPITLPLSLQMECRGGQPITILLQIEWIRGHPIPLPLQNVRLVISSPLPFRENVEVTIPSSLPFRENGEVDIPYTIDNLSNLCSIQYTQYIFAVPNGVLDPQVPVFQSFQSCKSCNLVTKLLWGGPRPKIYPRHGCINVPHSPFGPPWGLLGRSKIPFERQLGASQRSKKHQVAYLSSNLQSNKLTQHKK